jgi:cytoskeletal protein CcmA (bactofilin family)
MAIFNSNDLKNQNSPQTISSTTIITIGSAIKGEMNLKCNLFIDGDFEGVIHSDHDVTIGKNGRVHGEIFAKRVTVQGIVQGNIDTYSIEIKPSGKVQGTITSKELSIDPRGIFEGNSVIKKEEEGVDVEYFLNLPPKKEILI